MRDYAQVKADGSINVTLAQQALELMAIDKQGLDEVDRKLLKIIAENFAGGPVGLSTLAASLQEEAGTIEEIFEPYMMQLGFLARTNKGRVLTDKAYEYLGLAKPRNGQPLF